MKPQYKSSDKKQKIVYKETYNKYNHKLPEPDSRATEWQGKNMVWQRRRNDIFSFRST